MINDIEVEWKRMRTPTKKQGLFVIPYLKNVHLVKDYKSHFGIMISDTLEIIEVQTGNYLGEDDIKRLEDDYERTLNS